MKTFIKQRLREELEVKNDLSAVEVGKILYHCSNHHFRDEISKLGLIPKGKRVKLPKSNVVYKHVITFESIPLSHIKLIYKGDGTNKD